MKNIFLAFFALLFVIPATVWAATTPPAQSICIKKSGLLIIRKGFCKSNEKSATTANITAGLAVIPTAIGRRVEVSALTQPFVDRSLYSSVAFCLADEVLSGGGCQTSDPQLLLQDAHPITLAGIQRFHCNYYNSGATITATLTAHAICLKLQ